MPGLYAGMELAIPSTMSKTRKARHLLGMDLYLTPFTGWLTPRGEWLPAQYGAHLEAAAAAGEDYPERNGWCHIQGGRVDPIDARHKATRAQTDAIITAVLEGRVTMPGWLS